MKFLIRIIYCQDACSKAKIWNSISGNDSSDSGIDKVGDASETNNRKVVVFVNGGLRKSNNN